MGSPVPAPDRRPAVVLHVGMSKTGTSTLQATFARSRRRLARHGILYPTSPGRRRHIRLGLAMQPDDGSPRQSVGWRRQEVSTPGELRPLLERELLAELATDPRLVLFSDEALLPASDSGLAHLRELLDRIASSVRVVVYLRRQDDHLRSRYQQAVKREGEVRLLSERARRDQSRVYDYHSRLVAWRDLLDPDELVVRTFERSRFENRSLLEDFLLAAGLDVSAADLADVASRNETLDAEAVEFLRLVNLHRAERGERASRRLTNSLVRRLEQLPRGPVLTLPEEQLEEFRARWASGNEAVARDFTDSPDQPLFHDPSATDGLTADQHLDPARLDRFLEVLDLPELHAPLHRLAATQADLRVAGH